MLLLRKIFIYILIMVCAGCIVIFSYSTTFPESTLNVLPNNFRDPITLKIITYNVKDIMIASNYRSERMLAIALKLCELDPDIIGFQEIFIESDRTILIEELRINSRLRYHLYYPSGLVGSGLLISSAFPIIEKSFHQFKDTNQFYKVWEGDYWAGKGVALARLKLPDKNGYIDFFNTHAQAGYGDSEYDIVRKNQMIELAKFMNESRENTSLAILAGDMNCGPGENDFETAVENASLLRIMKIESGIDHIFAVNNNNYKIDVLDSGSITGNISIENKSIPFSDHNGYLTVVRITPED